MNKFARWLGYLVAQFKADYAQGRADFENTQLHAKALSAIRQLIQDEPQANYIPAIKLHRQYFDSSLKVAKDAVDAIRAQAQ